jgi:exonuclease SbcC
MNKIRIVHTADIHFSRETKSKVFESLEVIAKEEADLMVIAGDFWDQAVRNTKSSGFPELIKMVKRLLDKFPIVAVQGTSSHDIEGSYEVLEGIAGKHWFTLLRPGNRYYLTASGMVTNLDVEDNKLLIMGMPEPTTARLHSMMDLSKEKGIQTVNETLKEMLLGYGMLRAETPDIPAIFVFHGLVGGSMVGETQVIPSGQIQIDRNDLQRIGAQAVLGGHIHKGQEIEGVIGGYSGSVFNTTRGDRDQKYYQVITIEEIADLKGGQRRWKTSVEKRNFPHSPMVKIEMNKGDSMDWKKFKGKKVWLVVNCAEEDREQCREEGYKEMLSTYGAHHESRVDIKKFRRETVRAEGIRERKGLVEKCEMYATLRGEELTEDRRAKIEEIETSLGTMVDTNGANIRLLSLRVVGAKGFKDKSGLEVVEVEFDKIERGLVAVVGPNGAGKTTLFEMCTPWPRLFTRSGKFRDHFYRSDSERDLRWVDESTGITYRSLIKIDPSKGCEYFMYQGDGEKWEKLPGISGNLDPYLKWCTRLWGPLPLFLRTVFQTQSGVKGSVDGAKIPNLEDATKKDLKWLITALLGIGHYQSGSEQAKERYKVTVEHGSRVLENINTKRQRVAEVGAVGDYVEKLRIAKDNIYGAKDHEEIKAVNLKKAISGLEEKVKEQIELQTRMTHTESEHGRLISASDELKNNIDLMESNIKGADRLREQVKEWEKLKADHDEEEAKYQIACSDHTAKKMDQEKNIAALRVEISNMENNHNTERNTLINGIDNQIHKIKAELQTKTHEAEMVTTFIKNNDVREPSTKCPVCQNYLSDEKRHELTMEWEKRCELNIEYQSKHFRIEDEIKNLREQIVLTEHDRRCKIQEVEERHRIELSVLEKIMEKLLNLEINLSGDWSNLLRLRQELETIPIEQIKLKIGQAEKSMIKIDAAKQQLLDNRKRISQLSEELQGIREKINPAHAEEKQYKKDELEQVESKIKMYTSEIATLTERIATMEKKQEETERLKAEINELEKKRSTYNKEAAGWNWVSKALGPDGIQALEIDAAGPEITGIANGLLRDIYGDDAEIKFETVKMGKDKTQKEVFEIRVYDPASKDIDGENGRSLLNCSGGQLRWRCRALEDAFSIVRMNSTFSPYMFQMQFRDEGDDGLSPEAKNNYYRMLTEYVEQAGVRHMFVITHSEAIQEIITNQIRIEELEGEK